MKKFLSLLFITASVLLSSCGKDKKDEPQTEVLVPVYETYVPAAVTFDRNDTQFLNRCRKWSEKILVVDSADELPDDPLGFSPTYSKINFRDNSLLVTYKLHKWSIDTYTNRFVLNNLTGTYDWTISLGSSSFSGDGSNNVTFTRFAIEVPKLPAGADVTAQFLLYDSGWDWDD